MKKGWIPLTWLAVILAGYVAIGSVGSRYASGFFEDRGGAAGVSAFVSALTAILVGWYLYETHLLRKTAEREYEPFLVLTFDPSPNVGPPNLFLRNLGRGPAVSVEIEGLEVPGITGMEDYRLRLRVPAISPASSSAGSLPLIRWDFGQNYQLVAQDFDGQRVSIRFTDPAGRKYSPIVWLGDSAWGDGFRMETPVALPKGSSARPRARKREDVSMAEDKKPSWIRALSDEELVDGLANEPERSQVGLARVIEATRRLKFSVERLNRSTTLLSLAMIGLAVVQVVIGFLQIFFSRR
jgi:hypothetical protein